MRMWIAIAVIALLLMGVIGIVSSIRQKASSAEKVISIICSVLCVLIALAGIGYSRQKYVTIEDGFIEDSVIVNGDDNTVTIYNDNTDSDETFYLIDAQKSINNGSYREALSDFEYLADKGYESGALGLGYLYAHGYGVDQDIDKATQFYESINNNPQARKNKLALLIASNNREAAESELEYFINKGDQDVLDYIDYCEYVTKHRYSLEDEDLSNLRCYMSVGREDYDNPPRDTGYSVFKFIGAHYPDDNNRSLPLYAYEEYRLMFIDSIECAVIR